MKVRCIVNKGRKLTVDKVYEVVDKSSDFYYLDDDDGELGDFGRWRFEEFVEQPVESSELFPIY